MTLSAKDIIRVAKEIFKNDNIIVSRKDLLSTSNSTVPFDLVSEQCLNNIPTPLRDTLRVCDVFCGLKSVVEQAFGRPIKILEVDADGAPLYGDVKVYPDGAVIYYKKGSTACWIRFTVAKELLHLYTKTTGCRATLSEHLFSEAKNARERIVNTNALLTDEQAAYYLAIEILLPFSLRRSQYIPLTDLFGEDNPYPVAKAFMCPRAIIQQIREDGYIELSYRLNSELEYE